MLKLISTISILLFTIGAYCQNTIFELYTIENQYCSILEESKIEDGTASLKKNYGPSGRPSSFGSLDDENERLRIYKQIISNFPKHFKKTKIDRSIKEDIILDNGAILFYQNKKWGWKDKEGKLILSPQFDFVYSDTIQKGFIAYKNGTCNYYKSNSSKPLFKNNFYDIKVIDTINFATHDGIGVGLLSKENQLLIPHQNKRISPRQFESKHYYLIRTNTDQLYLYLEKSNQRIYIKTPIYESSEIEFWNDTHIVIAGLVIDLKKGTQLICEEGYRLEVVNAKNKWATFKKKRGSKTYLIDFQGNILSNRHYNQFKKFDKNGLAIMTSYVNEADKPAYPSNYKYGLLNEELEFLVPPEFNHIYPLGLNNKLYLIKKSRREIGLLDHKGKFLIPFGHQKFNLINKDLIYLKKDSIEFGKIIDYKRGQVVKNGLPYDEIKEYTNTKCPNTLYIGVNKNGEIVLDDNFQAIISVTYKRIFGIENGFRGWTDGNEILYDCLGKKLQLPQVKKDKKQAYKNMTVVDSHLIVVTDELGNSFFLKENGKKIENPERWSRIRNASYKDYYTGENKKGYSGLFNTHGKTIIPPIFSFLGGFQADGLASFEINDQLLGYIDANGAILFGGEYDTVKKIGFDCFKVSKNGMYGIVDYDNKIIIPIVYDQIWLSNGLFSALKNDKNEVYFSIVGDKIENK